MPSLVDTLTTSFKGDDNFDLGSAFSALGSTATAVAPSGVSFDQNALGRITQGLGPGAFGGIGTAVTGVLQQASGLTIAAPDTLVQPLTGAFGTASQFATADPRALLRLFEDAAATGDGSVGLASLAGPLSALSTVRSDPLVGTALQLFTAAVPGAARVEQTVTAVTTPAAGFAALV